MGSDYHSRSAINPADNTCDPTTAKVQVTCSHTRVDLCLHPRTLEHSRFCPKLPCWSFQEMTVNPWLPTNCPADCPHHRQGNDDAPVMKIPSRITLVPEDDQTLWDPHGLYTLLVHLGSHWWSHLQSWQCFQKWIYINNTFFFFKKNG